MTRLRVVPYRRMKKVAEACGFMWDRCEGSHNIFKHADGRIVTIPNHGADPIVRPLARKIIRDLGISVEEYNRLLDG
jgi:predicted RNA binding protein YcfA (HicA-like mRNA interferase family)